MAKAEATSVNVPTFTFTMKVEGKTFTVSVPEISIPSERLVDIIREYIKVLATQTARYMAVKTAQREEEFKQELASRVRLVEAYIKRKLSEEELANLKNEVLSELGFADSFRITVTGEILKSRLGL